jgi:acyl-CoA thioester hydrolase
MAAVQQNLSYKRELLPGDVVAVRSGMLEMRDKVAKFVHEMRHAQTGEISAVCVLTAVHMDSKARKSTSFPTELIARGKTMLCEYKIEP